MSGSLLSAYFLSDGYRRITIYDDRMEIIDKSQTENTVLYFENIHQIGFLGGTFGASNAYAGTDLGDAQVTNLIILLKDGRREEFRAYDFNHLSEVYSILHERTNL